jgi:hypothetical protein
MAAGSAAVWAAAFHLAAAARGGRPRRCATGMMCPKVATMYACNVAYPFFGLQLCSVASNELTMVMQSAH